MVSAGRVALACWCALLALQPTWYLWWRPPAGLPPAWATAVMSLPLLAVLPGLLRDAPRAHLWAGYVAVFYFMHGVVVAMTHPAARAAGLLETALTLAFIAAAVMRLRHPAR